MEGFSSAKKNLLLTFESSAQEDKKHEKWELAEAGEQYFQVRTLLCPNINYMPIEEKDTENSRGTKKVLVCPHHLHPVSPKSSLNKHVVHTTCTNIDDDEILREVFL